VDISGTSTYRKLKRTRGKSSMRGDWHAIGQDFWVAVDTVKADSPPSRA